MKKSLLIRILVAVIGVPLLISVMVVLPPIAAPIAIALVCAFCAAEFLHAATALSIPRIYLFPVLASLCIPFGFYYGYSREVSAIALFAVTTDMFLELMISREKGGAFSLRGALAGIFCGAVTPCFLSGLLEIKAMDHGIWLVLLPFVISMLSDTGGYFIGIAFGKHHPFRELSPHKSTEGCFGSLVFGILFSILYGIGVGHFSGIEVNILHFALIGLVANPFVQFGDLAFSAVKREAGIKDFSRLLGDHGGMQDRFDSTFFCVPVVFAMLRLFPVFM